MKKLQQLLKMYVQEREDKKRELELVDSRIKKVKKKIIVSLLKRT